MRTFIVSDDDHSTHRVREVLLREGIECPREHLLPATVDLFRLRKQDPQLIVFVIQDDREASLKSLTTLRQLPGCSIVVVGPIEDSRLVLRVCHVGVHDYIDLNELNEGLPAAIQRLRSEITEHSTSQRTIAVYSPSGGCGVSTLAANVAVVLAKQHEKSLLIDLNMQTGDLATLLDVRPTHTLADLCSHARQLDRTMLDRALVRHASGVHLLAPPFHLVDAERITPEGIRQVVSLGSKLFPYVIVDLEHLLTHAQEQVLQLADIILLVVRLDFAVLRNTRRALEYFDQLNINRDRVRIVANRYGQSNEVPYSKAEEGLGMKITHYIPNDCKSVNRANNCGIPVVLDSAYAKVSRSLTNLAHGVNGTFVAAELAQAE